ncbi:hypothetical protein SUGI_1198370 [Cryptomeria japonica]|nr:hypothetical protein SUGI_1198370 [Cryptomeria japonica]
MSTYKLENDLIEEAMNARSVMTHRCPPATHVWHAKDRQFSSGCGGEKRRKHATLVKICSCWNVMFLL